MIYQSRRHQRRPVKAKKQLHQQKKSREIDREAAWRSNMAYTLTKLDDAIVELHEGLQATLIPVMEENKYLRNELSEVKALLS